MHSTRLEHADSSVPVGDWQGREKVPIYFSQFRNRAGAKSSRPAVSPDPPTKRAGRQSPRRLSPGLIETQVAFVRSSSREMPSSGRGYPQRIGDRGSPIGRRSPLLFGRRPARTLRRPSDPSCCTRLESHPEARRGNAGAAVAPGFRFPTPPSLAFDCGVDSERRPGICRRPDFPGTD